MAQQQPDADAYAQSPVPDIDGGLVHVFHPHHDDFTVLPHHLTLHPELSFLAIGLAGYILSLGPGAEVDIKALSERFPEDEAEIAAALRELEAHGYLAPDA